jgi:hypothetical protein
MRGSPLYVKCKILHLVWVRLKIKCWDFRPEKFGAAFEIVDLLITFRIMKRGFTLALLLFLAQANASHITGGEFRLSHVNGFQFRVSLIIYFDEFNGSPAAKDFSVTARVFRNSDNAFIRDITLPLTSETNLNYTQLACEIGSVRIKELVYSNIITLQPDVFNDPDGYYLAWERCCRNYTITNIFSDAPPTGQAAGQTFFLQFPPVMKNGGPFINSSPRLFKPMADYACVGHPYYADFSGQDPDGDSLVYSITTPLSTHTFDALPAVGAKPFPDVLWRPSFGLSSILGAGSSLTIDQKGFIRMQSDLVGLFAYAI